MPEKTTETPTANGTRTPEKLEETTYRYMREAEATARDAMRGYNDMIKTTTNYYYETWDKTLRYGMEYTKYTTDAWENLWTMYRRMYTDYYKTWETYSEATYKMMPLPR